jgi:ABC-type Mn2+/Zn2+ transport system ATPase subunit
MGQEGSALSATSIGLRGKQGRWLFRDISVELRPREIVRVGGPPGSGVSALLQVMAGVQRPSRGSIRLRAPSIGYVPQHFGENLPMSAEEYLTWLGRVRGLRSDVRQSRISQLSRSFELGTAAGQRLTVVAGSREQVARRIAIMQALLDDPALLVLDNPWVSTDGHLRDLLSHKVLELSAAGCLVIFSGFAPALRASRHLTLTGGRVQDTDYDPAAHGETHLRCELAGNGVDLLGLPGVIEQHKHPDGLVVTVERAHSDELIMRAVQGGWSVRRVEPTR